MKIPENILTDFKWVKVGKWIDDPSLSYKERFDKLNAHHILETNFLVNYIRQMVVEFDLADKEE